MVPPKYKVAEVLTLKSLKGKKGIKLDLACGHSKQPEHIGIDVVKAIGVDFLCDLQSYPWPIADNSVERVYCSHFIEHVKDLVKFMDELYRILKPGGKAFIAGPYYTSMRAWQDPTHVRELTDLTMHYFSKEGRKVIGVEQYDIKADFDFTYAYNMDPAWASRSEEARQFAIKHYNNVISDIQWHMTKK